MTALAAFHLTFRTIGEGQGATTNLTNPKKYEAHNEQIFELIVAPGGGVDDTGVQNLAFIRQGQAAEGDVSLGGGDDFMLKTTVHVTINSNGVVTATVVNEPKNECM